jgi:membrane protein implicated in regulation of membrane protease activity
MEITTVRWAVASFLGGVAGLALGAIPLTAVCVGAGSVAFRHALLVAVLVVAACAVGIALALDLLGQRARRRPAGRRASDWQLLGKRARKQGPVGRTRPRLRW